MLKTHVRYQLKNHFWQRVSKSGMKLNTNRHSIVNKRQDKLWDMMLCILNLRNQVRQYSAPKWQKSF